jgi:peptidoglycan/xylan/chitin deacetylase (PgdA/CDA1 family)
LMTEDEIKSLPLDLITVGSHTSHHPRLTVLNETEILQELTHSKETLEKLTGQRVTMLSFPYGDHDEKVDHLARKAGYDELFSNVPLAVKTPTYLRGRINVTLNDWMIEYRLKLRGAYQWLSFAILLKHKMLPSSKKSGRRCE